MTDTPAAVPASATPKPENVGRGTIFALATIPIAIIVFAIFGYLGVYPFIVGIATPFIAGWLYRLGSGGQFTRAGWVPFIVISVVAVVLGTLAGAVAAVYKVFGFGTQFGSALGINLRDITPGGQGFFAILGLILGIVGIVITLRRGAATPGQQIAADTAQWAPPPSTGAAPPPPPANSDKPADPDKA